ncbi:YjjG family noncanonical pyrimidine nucleotidase [Pigmentibacter sp. JX0631]|uniref:YjjG family noncanonical pyrimidine nucleotidase n=1 Tax=Pigmentibacter sp. JX0631 TaxID=2976982 RepID=UPI0024684013|nr:YjjG family noncanonical pyrimidine nucleotidase [Pigmentibacter sp. JX0631]WGL61106.1 YjjG family noncanonical pyrimidine nucleotidase [Pigmentibacter sp. JX0631]
MKYSLIFFDADDTLFDFNKSQKIAFKEAITHFNINYHQDLLYFEYQKLNKELWTLLEKGDINANDLKILRFQKLFETHQIQQDPKIFANFYIEKISKSTHTIPYAEQLCHIIHANNIEIGIITNGFTDTQKPRLQASSLSKYFKSVTISEEVGARKPQAEIFNLALAKHSHIPKEKVLMVGDNLEADIHGAKNAGLDTCWLHRTGLKTKQNANTNYIITELKQLLKILEINLNHSNF